jgi:hypothetical protein
LLPVLVVSYCPCFLDLFSVFNPPSPKGGEVSFFLPFFTTPCQASAAVKTTKLAACHGNITTQACNYARQSQPSGKMTTEEMRMAREEATTNEEHAKKGGQAPSKEAALGCPVWCAVIVVVVASAKLPRRLL